MKLAARSRAARNPGRTLTAAKQSVNGATHFLIEVRMIATLLPTPANTEHKLNKVDPDPAITYICDRLFIREIRKLQLMRSIQRDEGLPQPPEISELWPLLRMHRARSGRLPNDLERAAVDRLSVSLSSTMTDESAKKKWVSSQVPMFIITILPLLTLLFAVLSLCSAVYGARQAAEP
jgi:hypothetical protein